MDRDSLAKEIKAITKTMLAQARAGNWDDLARLEARRKRCLENYFSDSVDQMHARQAAELVSEVLEADKKLIEHVNQVKTRFSQEHSCLKKGHKATSAYQSNQK